MRQGGNTIYNFVRGYFGGVSVSVIPPFSSDNHLDHSLGLALMKEQR
jgi:hypothetical protein